MPHGITLLFFLNGKPISPHNREERRNKKYDGIIMDPPSFGRGASGEVWKLEKDLWDLLIACKKILSDNPKFILINSYTSGLSPLSIYNIFKPA